MTKTAFSLGVMVVAGLALMTTGCSSSSDGGTLNPSTNRFVNNENGTVTDKTTSLTWLKDANCDVLQDLTWEEAKARVALLKSGECGLTDQSSPGRWRLPTKEEWYAILIGAGTPEDSCPNGPDLPNTAGTGCWSEGNPFVDVQWSGGSVGYWSSTLNGGEICTGCAWCAYPDNGNVQTYETDGHRKTWPVRS
jgi:hypothetical protein